MLIRVISSIVGLPILILIVLSGGLILKLGVLGIVLIGMYEFYKAVSKQINQVHWVGFLFAILYVTFIDQIPFSYYPLIMAASTFILLILLVILHTKINIIDCAVALFGFFYVCILMTNIYLVRSLNVYGTYLVWLIFICAWCSDTGAYFTGVKLGKHKLVPVLSPNKTIEGAIGGIVFTGCMAAVYGLIISKFFTTDEMNFVFQFVIIGVVGSVFAQLGDLAASSIKRYTNIKDYGKVMLGHGGVLDRFDSVLFTAPIVYFLMIIMVKVA